MNGPKSPRHRLVLAFCAMMMVSHAAAPASGIGRQPPLSDAPGMVSYTYRDAFAKDFEATLDKIRSLGITDMEFSSLFGKSAAEIRRLLDDRGMACSSFGVSYDDAVNATDRVAEDAKTLGAKYVRVAWIPHQPPLSIRRVREVVADFDRVGKRLLDQHGLVFCYHNHGYEFQPHGDGTLFDVLLAETDPRYVSIELDILWVHFPGVDPVEILRRYGDRIKLMHLKDLKKGVEGNLSGTTPVENDVALGTGQIDLPRILAAAKEAGVKHYYIEDESRSVDTQVPRSLEYLKRLTLSQN
jgi:sugar phosphate isomerase/epimerase